MLLFISKSRYIYISRYIVSIYIVHESLDLEYILCIQHLKVNIPCIYNEIHITYIFISRYKVSGYIIVSTCISRS